MKIDANDPEFQKYARSIGYGDPYNDERFNPDSPLFRPKLDNESALVAMNDGCYHDHGRPGCFVRFEDVPHHEKEQGEYKAAADSDLWFWIPIVFVLAFSLIVGS